jgi:hypothetical protein
LLFNDANNLGEPSDIIENEADLYHVVIEYNGKYYDGTGIVTPDTLLDIAYDQYGDATPGWFTESNPFDKKVEQVIRSETNWNKPAASFYKALSEASGYIPSAKEKNDPRFKTALTVDVKPNSIKKNAKAFGFKTSRAGIPPQARADGKITEALVVYAPDKKFATELEELQHICSTVKDFRARFKILESLGSKTLTENKQEFNDLCADVIRSLGSLSAKNLKVGNAYIPVQVAVHRNVVVFYDVKNNSPAHEPAEFGTLVKLDPNAALVKIGNTTYQYPFELSGANTMMMTVFLDTVEKYDQFRMMTELKFDQNLPLYKDSNDSPETNGKRRPMIGYHVTATKNLPVIRKNGIKADRRGNSYVWDSFEMAEWFTDFQNDDGQDRTILKIDMTGLDAHPDPEAEDMSDWSSRFEPGTNGGAWIVSGPISPDKIMT